MGTNCLKVIILFKVMTVCGAIIIIRDHHVPTSCSCSCPIMSSVTHLIGSVSSPFVFQLLCSLFCSIAMALFLTALKLERHKPSGSDAETRRRSETKKKKNGNG